MSSSGRKPPPHRRPPGGRIVRRIITALTAGLLVVLPAAPALAHGGGDSDQSRVLVLEALTYLANTPAGYEDMAADKIGDALEAPDQEGVDLTEVSAAKQKFDAGDLAATRTLLQQSVQPLTDPVTGEETGTTQLLDPAPGHVTWSGWNGVLAGLSALAALVGAVLAARTRPGESIRTLKSRLAGGRS